MRVAHVNQSTIAMKATDDVFVLIKSLTKSERRYFKLYAARQGSEDGSDYIQLFDLIDAMERNDEDAIRRELGQEKGRYLPQMKYYLYRTILRALNQFHASSSNEAQINELLQADDVLYAKRLFGQCRKLLVKARKLAARNDSPIHLIRILLHEYRLAVLDPDCDHAREEVDAIFTELATAGQRTLLRFRYWRVQSLMFIATTAADAGPGGTSWVDDLLNDPVMLLGEPEGDPFATLLYLFIHHHHAIARHNYADSYHWSRRIVELIESEPSFHERIAERYIPAQHNLCMAVVQTGRMEEFDREYRKLMALAAQARSANPSFDDLTIHMLEPRAELARGEFVKAASLLEPLEAQFRASCDSLRIGFSTYFNYLFAYSYFGAGRHRMALGWIGNILNDRNVSTHEDLHCHARILNLLVHYELGNFENLEFYAASTVRFLTRRKKLSAMESLVIDMIRKLLAAPEGPAARGILAQTLKKIRETGSPALEAVSLLDTAAWIEAKLTGESFATVVRRKLATPVVPGHHDIDARSAVCA
jgi:hypothetical protein